MMWTIRRLFVGITLATSTIASGGEAQINVDECVVRFASEVNVPALETGSVARMNVKLNDAIDAGAPIASLDDRSMLILRQAASRRLELAKSIAVDDVEIRYAEVAMQEAEAELETSRSIQNDVRGAIPLTQIRRLRLAVERAKLEISQAEKRKQQAQTESELRQTDLSLIDEQLRNLHADSPISGIVLSLFHSAGEWVAKGETIATVGQVDRLHIHALVDSQQIAPGQCKGLPVSVRWNDAATGELVSLRGSVLSVDPQLLPNRVFRLHAEIINQKRDDASGGWLLLPGTDVRMTIYTPTSVTHQTPRSTVR
ncbi:hypothetical protein Poly51_33580 [Rubripirellula tenax]|uniref:Multidrug resistance protein MdtN n=1 Tax=Rubripirellula tenax TaxID=2528015 RepID=A0A5C6F4A7_9BACT|nr:HlyD family efflux transporter periplasmic adaptor subunit [Rubripirellula tenax]TWU54639.1 hypothetical protein Poly51_33580 [Rubripirellula tenax]